MITPVLVQELSELAPAELRTIVINVDTDLVATRALFSAVELTGAPVLLVNCSPKPRSRAHFEALAEVIDFDIYETALNFHGSTLDLVLADLHDDTVLLLDSDAELRDPEHVRWMRRMLANPLAFGAGFTWGPFWVPTAWQAPEQKILYMERPWLPCAMWRLAAVHDALAADRTFLAEMKPNEFPFSRKLSNLSASRWGPPWSIRHWVYEGLPEWAKRRVATIETDRFRWLRHRYHSLQPAMACYDTAASVYEYLRFEKQMLWAGIPMEFIDGEVHHYSGVTRFAIHGRTAFDVSEAEVRDEVVLRLKERYDYAWSDD